MRAKILLGRLNMQASLAETIERLEQTLRESGDSPAHHVIIARVKYLRGLYERAIGLPPEQRHTLEAALKPIIETGRERVADLLVRLRESRLGITS